MSKTDNTYPNKYTKLYLNILKKDIITYLYCKLNYTLLTIAWYKTFLNIFFILSNVAKF